MRQPLFHSFIYKIDYTPYKQGHGDVQKEQAQDELAAEEGDILHIFILWEFLGKNQGKIF
ncbi:hypothetical protein [Megasphaera sp.]|uniref:hypothetical protein n=1 Tax=Megasphaera sp. TaxID=2023260 RepID=UPI00351F9AAF